MATSAPPSVLRTLYKRRVAPWLSESLRFKLTFLSKQGYWPDMQHPRSLMEKVAWLLRYDRNPLRAQVADRVKVREFVAQYAPECKMPAHLWLGTDLTAATWETLPDKFVIKGNHGSQMTMMVNKSKHSLEEVRKATASWLQLDYSAVHQEWVYAHASRVLVVEEMLELESDAPPDWKFLCGNGKTLLIQLDLGRFATHRRNLYNREFVRFQDAMIADLPGGVDVAKPVAFGKALAIAEKLAAQFDFIRVDLYIVGNDIYFGELTNYPGAAMDALKPKSLDFAIGSQIKLDGLHTKR
ncbi:MAG: ATP-grasp fold amidoligase family protein [Pseudomonadota bacterium]